MIALGGLRKPLNWADDLGRDTAMIYGADATFLVQSSISDISENQAALRLRDRLLDEGHIVALAPQVLAEFVHIAMDPRRLRRPLTIPEALRPS